MEVPKRKRKISLPPKLLLFLYCHTCNDEFVSFGIFGAFRDYINTEVNDAVCTHIFKKISQCHHSIIQTRIRIFIFSIVHSPTFIFQEIIIVCYFTLSLFFFLVAGSFQPSAMTIQIHAADSLIIESY